MDELLDRFFDRLGFSFRLEFSHFVIKVSQVKGSFYVLVRKPREKILGDNFKNLLMKLNVFLREYIINSLMVVRNFTINFKLVRCYGNYQYHFCSC